MMNCFLIPLSTELFLLHLLDFFHYFFPFRQPARFWNRAHVTSKQISYTMVICSMSRYTNRSGTAASRSSCLLNSHSQGQPDPSRNSSTGFSLNTSPKLCEHSSRGGHQCWRELLTLGLLSYNLFLLFCQNLSSAQKPSIKLDYWLVVESIMVACFRHWIQKIIATFYFTLLTFFPLIWEFTLCNSDFINSQLSLMKWQFRNRKSQVCL